MDIGETQKIEPESPERSRSKNDHVTNLEPEKLAAECQRLSIKQLT